MLIVSGLYTSLTIPQVLVLPSKTSIVSVVYDKLWYELICAEWVPSILRVFASIRKDCNVADYWPILVTASHLPGMLITYRLDLTCKLHRQCTGRRIHIPSPAASDKQQNTTQPYHFLTCVPYHSLPLTKTHYQETIHHVPFFFGAENIDSL